MDFSLHVDRISMELSFLCNLRDLRLECNTVSQVPVSPMAKVKKNRVLIQDKNKKHQVYYYFKQKYNSCICGTMNRDSCLLVRSSFPFSTKALN